MATPNPFNMPNYHLGDTSSYTKVDVDASFKVANIPSSHLCIACGQLARYKLIAKENCPIPQHVLDRDGYLCEYHLAQNIYPPQYYAVSDLGGLGRGSLPIL